MSSGSFSAVRSIDQTGTTQNFVGDLASVGNLFDVGNNGLVFKLPYSAVKTLYTANNPSVVDTVYVVKQLFETSGSTISIASGQGTFINTSSITASLGPGLIDSTPTISSGSDGSTSLTFSDVSGVTPGSTTLKVMADVQKNLLHKTKTRNDDETATGALSGGSLSLGKADIIRIVSVTDAQSTDITERFTLDNGQRDNFYDIGKVNLKPGFSTPSGNITVTFDFYSHGSGDYFTVDSYPTADYNTIPSFNSQQGTLQLRDCLDFRPRKDDAGTQFTGSGGSHPQPPKPGHAAIAEVTHYMPRIDKVYITRQGEFKTEIGVPSLTPKAPETPEDAMAIYNLKLAPYVFSLDGVIPELIDNKRYTMKDIGSLDKRIKNLEYYTSLSLLEQSAADVELYDGSGFSILKNGFIVDGFRGHNIADTGNVDYSASIDKNAGILRPKFDERNVNLVRKSSDSGTAVKNGSIVTMPQTETNYINQPYSSFASNVNPYNVFSWAGMMELSPESDEWKETDVRPNVVIDDSASYDQFAQMVEEQGILGTVWNEWETNWQGVEVDVDTQLTPGRQVGRRANLFNLRGFPFEEGFFGFGGPAVVGGSETTITSTTTTTNQSRSGLRTDLSFDTVQRTDGTRVVEVNFVPFIRSRKIFFKAQLLKPNTKVYPFFDGVNVSNYCIETSYTEFSDRTDVK